jgi:hypothetical protein
MKPIKVIYVGNDHYQSTEKDIIGNYWTIYIPSVLAKQMEIDPDKLLQGKYSNRLLELSLQSAKQEATK